MAQHYFQSPNYDLADIQNKLVFWFKEHEYKVDMADDNGIYLVQGQKTGKLRTLTGTNLAFKIKLYASDQPEEFIFESSIGKWTSNLAGAGITALFTGGLTLLTGAAGGAWAVKVERDIIEYMEQQLQYRRTKTVEEPGAVAASDGPPVDVLAAAAPIELIALSPREQAEATVHEKIEKLSEAHANGILDDKEFEKKKKELEAKIDEYETDILMEERMEKLKEALDAGILDQKEFDKKCGQLRKTLTEELKEQRASAGNAEKLEQLKAALDGGILSQDEYDKKVAALS